MQIDQEPTRCNEEQWCQNPWKEPKLKPEKLKTYKPRNKKPANQKIKMGSFINEEHARQCLNLRDVIYEWPPSEWG